MSQQQYDRKVKPIDTLSPEEGKRLLKLKWENERRRMRGQPPLPSPADPYSTIDLMLEFMDEMEDHIEDSRESTDEFICLLQPTKPIREMLPLEPQTKRHKKQK